MLQDFQGVCQIAGPVEQHKSGITHILQDFRGVCQIAGLVKQHKSGVTHILQHHQGFVNPLDSHDSNTTNLHTSFNTMYFPSVSIIIPLRECSPEASLA
jgi:hypothetical protein